MLEAGDEDTSPWIPMPAGVAKLFHHPRLNWRYRTEPEQALGGRSLYWPRGKVLGGTSSINGMTFVRGQAADYDSWSDMTNGAWSWRTVLPYFKRIEDSPFGTASFRGTGGPMRIGPVLNRHPLSEAFLQSSVAAGIPQNDDYNGATQEGIGYSQVMMRDGVRSSAASAYLAPVRGRSNLRVLTDSLVRRILVENGRAVGVELERKGGVETIRARREVLLCAGTIASPQLLLLSGACPRSARLPDQSAVVQPGSTGRPPCRPRGALCVAQARPPRSHGEPGEWIRALLASSRSTRPADRVPAVERRLRRGTLHRSRLPGRDGDGRFASAEEPRPCRAALGGSARGAGYRRRPSHR
jgi:choline dehydrogenase